MEEEIEDDLRKPNQQVDELSIALSYIKKQGYDCVVMSPDFLFLSSYQYWLQTDC